MRPKQQKLTALGTSPWVVVDFHSGAFGVGIGVNLSESADLTYSVQFTFDNPFKELDCTITRATTVATATFSENHGKAVGDDIQVNGIREDNLKGLFVIASVPSETTLTYTVVDTGSTSEKAKAVLYSVFTHPDLSSLTTKAEAALSQPPTAIRLNCTVFAVGTVTANYTFVDLPP